MKSILPGSTVGVLGSGQLGRMFAIAARRMGYRVHTYSSKSDTPTGQLCDREVCASYDDLDAVRDFARGVDVVTFEFENVPAATVEACAQFGAGATRLECALHRAKPLARKELSFKTWFSRRAVSRCEFARRFAKSLA